MNSVCLYSKYSSNSKKLLKTIADKIPNINYICVDNEKVRGRILNNKNIKIDYVPCILIIRETGIVEKYEGQHAFQWAQNLLEKLKPPKKNIPITKAKPIIPKKIHIQKRKEKKTAIDSISFEDPQTPAPKPPQTQTPKPPQTQTPKPPQTPVPKPPQTQTPVPKPPVATQLENQQGSNKAIKNENIKIADLAANMQKEREMLDSTIKKPPNYPKDK